ncbi:MAG: FISUMP domain-containing protein [Bacteroidota bacterium]
MNRQFLFLIFLTTFNSSLFSQSVTITNIQVSQRTDGSGLTDINFTMAGTASAYYIAVEASFNGGTTFASVPQTFLSGDTGPITSGIGKHIIWNGLQSFPNTFSTQAKVKLIVTTTLPAGSPCPGNPTIVYGGQTYNTVQIGAQCWLKENLNIGTKINGSINQTNNGIIEKYCYNDLELNCNIYGGLYQWNEMMQYVTTAGVQGICPAGWHVPTDAQWTVVTDFLGGTSVAGGKMKTTGTIQAGTGLWESPNGGATNESGFSAVPAGDRYTSGTFNFIGIYGYCWSSTEILTSYAWFWFMHFDYGTVGRIYDNKGYGFSVRCLRDF